MVNVAAFSVTRHVFNIVIFFFLLLLHKIIIVIFFFFFTKNWSSPILFIAEYKEDEDGSSPFCVTEANTFWPFFFFMASICLFFFCPLIVLVLIYTVIARHLVADPCTTSNHRIQVRFSFCIKSSIYTFEHFNTVLILFRWVACCFHLKFLCPLS